MNANLCNQTEKCRIPSVRPAGRGINRPMKKSGIYYCHMEVRVQNILHPVLGGNNIPPDNYSMFQEQPGECIPAYTVLFSYLGLCSTSRL